MCALAAHRSTGSECTKADSAGSTISGLITHLHAFNKCMNTSMKASGMAQWLRR